ncbi:hypothetical protein FZEAL_2382 [Fusarium zealandicum]|uniref:Ankyrin repeat protein n=1 Tax=Fusarium zealandicum TaxID=1053134 RepID=A0A8H4UQZ9_9HYPO|nr:hypothetical protein FZEAL_2382 [Fusarium zealandicum]
MASRKRPGSPLGNSATKRSKRLPKSDTYDKHDKKNDTKGHAPEDSHDLVPLFEVRLDISFRSMSKAALNDPPNDRKARRRVYGLREGEREPGSQSDEDELDSSRSPSSLGSVIENLCLRPTQVKYGDWEKGWRRRPHMPEDLRESDPASLPLTEANVGRLETEEAQPYIGELLSLSHVTRSSSAESIRSIRYEPSVVFSIDVERDYEGSHPPSAYESSEAAAHKFEEFLRNRKRSTSSEPSERSCDDVFFKYKWLEQIDGQGVLYDDTVATCDAKLIRRSQIRHQFWASMKKPTKKTSELAFELFDRYGLLDRELFEHPIRKGTGVWGNELDKGDILLFESISVKGRFRHRQIGTDMINKIIRTMGEKTTHFFALAKPGYLDQEVDVNDTAKTKHALKVSRKFFHSLGFRRIGVSPWFAFTNDPEHASKSLDALEDWIDPPPLKLSEKHLATFGSLADPGMSDEECAKQLQDEFRSQMKLNSGRPVDVNGNTVLHLAAVRSWFKSVTYIVERYSQLSSMRNMQGYTPREALLRSMEMFRTKREADPRSSDLFEGFDDASVGCIAVLRGFNIGDLAALSSSHNMDYLSRIKYGCSCGQCIDGFLSPRMQLVLKRQAEFHGEMLQGQVDNGPGWVNLHQLELRYVSLSVRLGMKAVKPLRQAFAGLCGYFVSCIQQGQSPNEANLLKTFEEETESPPVTKDYLNGGGTVASVAAMIFHDAMDGCLWAARNSLDQAPGIVAPEPCKEMTETPKCRNDIEFRFVAGMCGYELKST